MYKWLVCYLLKSSFEKYENNIKNGLDQFNAKNENQVYYARNLSVAFIQVIYFIIYSIFKCKFKIYFFQHLMLEKMFECINKAKEPQIIKSLSKLLSLYGLWTLEKHHLVTLYQGEFASGDKPATLIQDAILTLCRIIKDDAVALIDVIAPPDFVLDSVLGQSDGLVSIQFFFFRGNSTINLYRFINIFKEFYLGLQML